MTRTRMLIAGAALVAAAVLLGWLVVAVGDPVDGLDPGWNRLMAQIRQPWMLAVAHALNVIGGGWVATFLVPAAILVLLAALGRWRAAVYAALALLLSVGLTQLLKEVFGRARPEDLLVASDHGSFPSGHTANAATVAVLLFLVFRRRWVAVAGFTWILAMALSRTVLSVHWLTDTVGGALVGTGAAVLVAALLGRWASLGWRSATASAAAAVKEKSAVSRIRPYRPSDREAVYDVCLRTADVGRDATGILADDRLWGDLFAAPYVQRHPDLAWVVESADGRTIGYVVGTDDTDAFEAWFRDEWWPAVGDRYRLSGGSEPSRQDALIGLASRRGPGLTRHSADHPAHLHIDLLPETQGQGLGRRLIETLFDELRRRGVRGLHLSMNSANAAAGAFYERVGMSLLETTPDTTTYGIRFD
ncbi:GNAT family N-acetyltransferase [Microbacterium sp. NPDC058342]|uniref:GNAT family N-acetyltransferase n=1 Tax=Microbacterium sp. NPDC058342 TaxID=3346454 RepID=UPI00366548EE